MPIGVICPECGYSFSVRDEYAGKRGKCPQCKGVFVAEVAADTFEEAPMVVTNGAHARSKRNGYANGSTNGATGFAGMAVTAPAPASASASSSSYRREKAPGMPTWGWIAMGVMLLLAGGSIAGAFMLSPDPLEVKKVVKERTKKANKAVEKLENEVAEKFDEAEDKLPEIEKKVTEFARPKTLDEDVLPGVVKVLNMRQGQLAGTGTGWIANDQHWIVTNHHVVRGCQTLQVQTVDGKKHDIEGWIACKPEWDLAIIKPKDKLPGGKVLKIAPDDGSYLPNAGDKVWAIGNPASHTFTATRGIITRRVSQRQLINEASQTDTAFYADPQRDIMRIEHDARIFPGNSGGPLLDEHFRVIGVNTLLQIVPLQSAIDQALGELKKKGGDKRGPKATPTFGLASVSRYTLELLEEHKDGKIRPLSELPTEEP
jgi:S1-C subfamily serine protease